MARIFPSAYSFAKTVEDYGDGTGAMATAPEHLVLVSTLHASAAATATGQSSGIDLGRYIEAVAELNVTAASGTSPTLDVKFQTSDDDADWYDMDAAFAQITAAAKPAVLKMTNFGRYVRAVWTIGGTTPSFTFTLKLVAKT